MKIKRIIMSLKLMVLLLAITVVNAGRIYKLNTQESSFHDLQENYLCNYDQDKKEVVCFKTSLSDAESIDSIVVAPQGQAYETCGLGKGKGFIGTFVRTKAGQGRRRGYDGICSVWVGEKENTAPR